MALAIPVAWLASLLPAVQSTLLPAVQRWFNL